MLALAVICFFISGALLGYWYGCKPQPADDSVPENNPRVISGTGYATSSGTVNPANITWSNDINATND